MARKTFTTEEVLAFLEAEEDCELEGSDEEFDELDEVEDGIIIFYITILALYIPSLYCRD